MNILLWLVQILLALGFAASGVMKATWSRDRLVRSGQTGVQGLSTPLIRFIAWSELREPRNIAINLVILAACVVVVLGRS